MRGNVGFSLSSSSSSTPSAPRARRSAEADSDSFDSSESEYSESELEEEEEEEEEDSDDESFWALSCIRHWQDLRSRSHFDRPRFWLPDYCSKRRLNRWNLVTIRQSPASPMRYEDDINTWSFRANCGAVYRVLYIICCRSVDLLTVWFNGLIMIII